MEDLLDTWPGTLIVVSHDRYLLERVTDTQYALLGDNKVRHLTRGVDQYLELRKNMTKPAVIAAAAAASQGLSGAERRNLEKELARLERALEKARAEEKALHDQFAQADQTNFELLTNLMQLQRENQELMAELENSWLETSEKLEG
jgi:ATPase subunit of ABC transporter with duplicated ATPase domains